MKDNAPIWRSMLFVPAHSEKFIAKAAEKAKAGNGADAIILDLEDSVPMDLKAEARAGLSTACATLRDAGVDVLLRVNSYDDTCEDIAPEDLLAGVRAGVDGFVLPKIERANAVKYAAEKVAEFSANKKEWLLLAQIEHVNALICLDEIASSSPLLVGMSLGTEDFSASAGMSPTPETLYYPNQKIVFACRRAGITPYGFPASIAEFSDVDALQNHIEKARDMGFVGAMCIHPNQVAMLNKVMTPNPEDVQSSEALLHAWEQAKQQGLGAFKFNGKMVDKPVFMRAKELLRRHTSLSKSDINA